MPEINLPAVLKKIFSYHRIVSEIAVAKNVHVRRLLLTCFLGWSSFIISNAQTHGSHLVLNNEGYFEERGVNVLVFSNIYDGLFSDAKISGVEIIHHGDRTATNGDVRLSPTPGQWDPIPTLLQRTVDKESNTIEVQLSYPDHRFDYRIKVQAYNEGVLLSVLLPKPLPHELEGKAGFNLEFLPSAYFEKSYVMDSTSDFFPLYPTSSMESTKWGAVESKPIATGKMLVLAPEDPARQVTIESRLGDLMLYDGRNLAQNGWFVVRTLLPPGKSGKVAEWFIKPNATLKWMRTPVIGHSQVGYTPLQRKVAVIELDKYDQPKKTAQLLRVNWDGSMVNVYEGEQKHWGEYL